MWKRSELKKGARDNLKRNYGALVLVCFLMAFFIGEFGSTTSLLSQFSEQQKNQTQVKAVNEADVNTKTQKIIDNLQIGGVTAKASKGVLNNVVGQVGKAKSLLSSAGTLAGDIVQKKSAKTITFASLGLILSFLWLTVGKYLLIIGERRFFLENIHFKETSVKRMFFLYQHKKIINPAKVMLIKNIFQFLWMLTIVGGIIKAYSYKLVPFILAENPDIKWKDAITLSRKMMYGYKWKVFVLDLSFWYWYILKYVTFQALAILFLNPYLRGTEARLYEKLREEAFAAKLENVDLLRDNELFNEADEELNQYPSGTHMPRRFVIDYKRNYSVLNVIMFFFTFSFVGWAYEVSIHLVRGGVFVNRGTMYGPWLPIYGAGGVIILILLKKFRDKPALNFLMTMIVCGIVEYMTSFILEKTQGLRWWDYSGYLLNLNGRVCMEGLLVFSIGGADFVYILAPLFDDLYNKIPTRFKIPIVAVLLSAFCCDMTYSHFHPNTGKGITDYK